MDVWMTTQINEESKEPIEVVTTRTARIWLDSHGIIWDVEDAGCEHDIEDARANVAAYRTMGRGRKRPLLVDMSQMKSISREARSFYTSTEVSQVISSVALVVGSPLSRMIGNFFMGLNKGPVPTKIFSSTQAATVWLRQFV
jgi:hypothetical protein